MTIQEDKIAAEVDQINSLIGFKIIGSCTSEEGSFGLLLQKGSKKIVAWVDMDEEGNGPGHLNLQSGSVLAAS